MTGAKPKIIISGGQTGVDRAALDFALAHQIECGGFVPQGRRAEDGTIDAAYPHLIETATRDYSVRTELNVRHSDATLILSHGALTGGSKLTRKFAEKHARPFLHLDFLESTIEEAAVEARGWLAALDCEKLNIAGPRASTDAEIYEKTKLFLNRLFAPAEQNKKDEA